MPIAKEISDMLDLGHFSRFLTSNIALNRRGQVFTLCDGLRLFISMAMSIGISHNHRSVGTPL